MAGMLIAVDLSSFSASLISTGVELAKKLKISITLFSVVEAGIGIGLPEGGPIFIDNIPGRIQEVNARLEAYRTHYPDSDITVKVTSGNPKIEILEQAHAGNMSFLVVGTHGRTGLDHMLLGSNAEYIIRHSRIPVLVIPYNQAAH